MPNLYPNQCRLVTIWPLGINLNVIQNPNRATPIQRSSVIVSDDYVTILRNPHCYSRKTINNNVSIDTPLVCISMGPAMPYVLSYQRGMIWLVSWWICVFNITRSYWKWVSLISTSTKQCIVGLFLIFISIQQVNRSVCKACLTESIRINGVCTRRTEPANSIISIGDAMACDIFMVRLLLLDYTRFPDSSSIYGPFWW